MGTNIVTDILNTLFSGLTTAAQQIPAALGQAIVGFMTTQTGTGESAVTHLSDAGQIVVTFGAVSLALSLVYLGINFVLSWGHNR